MKIQVFKNNIFIQLLDSEISGKSKKLDLILIFQLPVSL